MRFFAPVFFLTMLLTTPLAADSGAMVNRYFTALNMKEVFKILHDEGVKAGLEIAEEEEGISVSPAWNARRAAMWATSASSCSQTGHSPMPRSKPSRCPRAVGQSSSRAAAATSTSRTRAASSRSPD